MQCNIYEIGISVQMKTGKYLPFLRKNLIINTVTICLERVKYV